MTFREFLESHGLEWPSFPPYQPLREPDPQAVREKEIAIQQEVSRWIAYFQQNPEEAKEIVNSMSVKKKLPNDPKISAAWRVVMQGIRNPGMN